MAVRVTSREALAQPQGFAPVNWLHRYSIGLKFAHFGGPLFDAVRSVVGKGAGKGGASPGGSGYTHTGASTIPDFDASSTLNLWDGGDWLAIIRVAQDAQSGVYRMLMSKRDTISGTGVWTLGVDSGDNLRVDSGVGTYVMVAGAPTDKAVHTYAFAQYGGTLYVFVDGVLKGTGSAPSAMTGNTSTLRLGVGRNDATSENLTGVYLTSLIWRGGGIPQLADIPSLSQNPYQIVLDDQVTPVSAGGAAAQLAGNAAATSAATGALGTSIKLAAAAAAVAAAAGAITTAIKLVSAAAGQAVASGALTAAIRLAGAGAAQSSASGQLTTAIRLAGDAAASASASGSIVGSAALSGGAVAQAVAAGVLSTSIKLAGAGAAAGSASGALTTAIQLAASTTSQVTAGASLSTGIRLAGSALGVATASAGFAGSAAVLAGAATSQATGAGSLSTAIRLQAAMAATAAASGALRTGPGFAAAAVGVAYASGTLSTSIKLQGDAVAFATASAALTAEIIIPTQRVWPVIGGNRTHTAQAGNRTFKA